MHRPYISAAGGYCMPGSGKKSSLFESYVFRLSRPSRLRFSGGSEAVAAFGARIGAVVKAEVDIIRLVFVCILDGKVAVRVASAKRRGMNIRCFQDGERRRFRRQFRQFVGAHLIRLSAGLPPDA